MKAEVLVASVAMVGFILSGSERPRAYAVRASLVWRLASHSCGIARAMLLCVRQVLLK
jgi:hypothetical protein